MASFLGLVDRADKVLEDIFDISEEAERQRREEFDKAVLIQAWYRGCRSREYLSSLHLAATEIQRVWRGFADRRRWRQMIRDEVDKLKSNFYNGMATQIQKTWRGFYSRKIIHDFYALKRYLKAVEEQNEAMRQLAAEEAERQERKRRAEEEEAAHKRLVSSAKAQHHLISTSAIPGVYKNPKRKEPDEMEFKLRAVTPLVAAEGIKTNREKTRAEKKCKMKDLKLPPLPPKPQGPFKDQKAVYIQRRKPLSPSLRVASSFFAADKARDVMAAEEWVQRIHDNKFKHVGVIPQPYEPLIHTRSPFVKSGFGSYFRDDLRQKWMSEKDFQSMVAPIPIFDNFNKTYDEKCHQCSY